MVLFGHDNLEIYLCCLIVLPTMKKKIHIKKIAEIPVFSGYLNDMRKIVSCVPIHYDAIVAYFSSAVYFDAFVAILVLKGSGKACINYKTYPVYADALILLSSSHLFHFAGCSKDFSCLCLFASKEFSDEMDSTDMIYKRIKYGVRLYSSPVLFLSRPNAEVLHERMTAVGKAIDHPEHFYYKEVILNTLFAFYLDLSDMIERHEVAHNEGNLTRYESTIKSFIELLAVNYREEHSVGFYASRLNLSAHYLTLIVKRVTGQSVCDFIYEMIYSEARTLLTHSRLSIQEIASVLNFSDQSSFGKFNTDAISCIDNLEWVNNVRASLYIIS